MKDVQNTGQFFEPDPALDLDAYRQKGFGIFKGPEELVELCFGKDQAIYQAERAMRPGETRESLPDGRLRVRFQAPVSIGVVRWILQYGSEVEVIGPEKLREWVQGEHRKAAFGEV